MSWARARITLAIHPSFGEEVVVCRSHGAGVVLVQASDGRHFMLPTGWTDLKPPALVAAVHKGQAVHLAPDALLELAAWIEARGADEDCKEVGHFDKRGESRGPDGQQRPSDGLTSGKPQRSATTNGRGRRRRPAAALVEQARSPDARRRQDGQKRGKR